MPPSRRMSQRTAHRCRKGTPLFAFRGCRAQLSPPLDQGMGALIRNGPLVQAHQTSTAAAVQERVKPQQVAAVVSMDALEVAAHCLQGVAAEAHEVRPGGPARAANDVIPRRPSYVCPPLLYRTMGALFWKALVLLRGPQLPILVRRLREGA